jgi:hypothetical protein
VPARGVGGGEAQGVEAPAAAWGVRGGEAQGVEAPAAAHGVGGGETHRVEAHSVWARVGVGGEPCRRGVRTTLALALDGDLGVRCAACGGFQAVEFVFLLWLAGGDRG